MGALSFPSYFEGHRQAPGTPLNYHLATSVFKTFAKHLDMRPDSDGRTPSNLSSQRHPIEYISKTNATGKKSDVK